MTRSRLLALAALVVLAADVAVVVDRVGDEPAAAPVPAPSLSPAPTAETVDEQVARVARIVEEVRGLTFTTLPQPTYLTSDELAGRVAGLVEDYTAAMADADRRILAALGAIPPDTDLRTLLQDALAGGVVGFYDTDTQELVVRAGEPGGRLSPLEELILAHELQHAVADQRLGLPDVGDDPGREDAAFAAQALVEGDATLTMQRYAEVALSVVDQLRLATEGLGGAELQPTGELPHLIRRSLEFPYREGLAFVRELVADGGWEAVDAAYERLPRTTAEILFPERYLDGEEPSPLSPVPSLEPPWQDAATVAVGAADLLFLFEAPGGDPQQALEDPYGAAAGWDGGLARLWTRGEESAIGVVLAGREGHDLCGAVTAWYQAAFPQADARRRASGERLAVEGPRQTAVVRCPDGAVHLGIAPDLDTARLLAP